MIDKLTLALVANAVVVGSGWGYLAAVVTQIRKDQSQIKKALGLENGSPGAFVRRVEWQISDKDQDEQIARLEDELRTLRNRLSAWRAK